MNPSELFDIWAPLWALWSRWAKPVLFAESSGGPPLAMEMEVLPKLDFSRHDDLALVVDLPSAESVKTGLALAELGYRPVPLFNGARGPRLPGFTGTAMVDNDAIAGWLVAGADMLQRHYLPPNAPPAFLLDLRRKSPGINPTPGRFDNRWVVFPQDFPSATFLLGHDIKRVLLLQSNPGSQPQADVAHVLLRWQQAGLDLLTADTQNAAHPQPLAVSRPSHFGSLWYRALALVGLRRNSAGGFGSIVPQPSSG